MGAYSIGSEIAALPSTELLSPLSRVLFPKFVELKEDLLKLKRAFLLALGVQCMVALPAGVGLVLVAPELVAALLGAKWSAAVPFIQILGAVNLVTAINVSGSYTLLALGRAKVTAVLSWMNVIVFVGLYFLMIPDDAASIATLRLTIAICSLLLSAYLIQRELPSLSSREMLSAIWRPAVASAVMGAALLELPSIAFLPVVAQLFIKVAFGAAVFIASLLLLWRLQSCPDGAESYLFENLRLSPMLEELVSKRRSDR
jgi:O-antigen/teichoic acid export membrane protein